MAVDFRCETCGKILSVDAQPGESVKCPHCGKKSAVPAALASLPRPQVAQAGATAPQQAPGQEEEEQQSQSEAVMTVLAHVMPWVISVFFHLGLMLVMMFIAIIVMDADADTAVAPPDPLRERKDDRFRETEDRGNRSRVHRQAFQPTPTRTREFSQHQTDKPTGVALRDDVMVISSLGGGGPEGGGLAPLGPRTPGGMPGGVGFFDREARAEYVVYVLDKSGSMLAGGRFDILRQKLAESIAVLGEGKMFHLIFFGEDVTPVESPPRRLVRATPRNQDEAMMFIEGVVAQGTTRVLPALERAFAALKSVPDPQAEKLIFLLSDGDFHGIGGAVNEYKGKVGNEAVIEWLRDNNPIVDIRDADGNVSKRRYVRIFTFLYEEEDAEGMRVLRQIAAEHEGEFKHVRRGE